MNAIAASSDAVYIASDGGLAIIEYEPYTLLKKAAFYERHLEEWGQKRLGFTHKLEWDKEGPMRWDRWTMQADGGTGGRDVVEPGAWLLAYWMGRYHNFITPPETTDPKLRSVDSDRNLSLGAKPYDGPPWPE